MSPEFRRLIIAVVLCMLLLGLGFIVWASAFYLAEKFHCSKELFDWVSLFLCFGGFLSLCVAGDKNCRKNERGND